MLVVAAALFGMFFFCTLYLQQVLGYSALKTGVAYLPFSLTLIGASALASRLVDRFTPKPVLGAGLLVSTAGFVLLTRVSGHGDYASHVLPAMIVLGAGLGMSFVPITIAATNGVAAADSGLASGLLNTTQQVGGSLGLAILSSVSTSRATSALDGGSPLPAALTHGFKGAFTVAAVLCAIGVVVALALAAAPPARGRRRTRRGGRAVLRPLPRRTVLRAPRARGRFRPSDARRPRAVLGGRQRPEPPDTGLDEHHRTRCLVRR